MSEVPHTSGGAVLGTVRISDRSLESLCTDGLTQMRTDPKGKRVAIGESVEGRLQPWL